MVHLLQVCSWWCIAGVYIFIIFASIECTGKYFRKIEISIDFDIGYTIGSGILQSSRAVINYISVTLQWTWQISNMYSMATKHETSFIAPRGLVGWRLDFKEIMNNLIISYIISYHITYRICIIRHYMHAKLIIMPKAEVNHTFRNEISSYSRVPL